MQVPLQSVKLKLCQLLKINITMRKFKREIPIRINKIQKMNKTI